MRDRRYVEDLSIRELEQVLMIRRREERLARLRRMRDAGQLRSTVNLEPVDYTSPEVSSTRALAPVSKFVLWRERILFAVEVAAVIALIAVVIALFVRVRALNREWKEGVGQFPTPTATPLIRVAILPGGHKPPTESGGEAQPLGPSPVIEIPTPGPRSPTRLVIPSINVDVPVVQGDSWEQLKKGAGHHIGSANPGERGNCFISGHNDIYGEIFRDLDKVKIGDEIIVYAGEQPYYYVVRATRIVEPDDVSVMYPTSTPILTLLTCYPYMVDSHRLVVIAELKR